MLIKSGPPGSVVAVGVVVTTFPAMLLHATTVVVFVVVTIVIVIFVIQLLKILPKGVDGKLDNTPFKVQWLVVAVYSGAGECAVAVYTAAAAAAVRARCFVQGQR